VDQPNFWLNINEVHMTNTIQRSKTVNKSEIAVIAYHLWEKAGHPASRDLQFWLDAEAQLCAAANTVTGPPAAHLPPVDSKINTAGKADSSLGSVRRTHESPSKKYPGSASRSPTARTI
jgi:hypothetical protein